MHSQNFRDRVVLQTRTKTRGVVGISSESWSNTRTLWASVVELDIKMTDAAGVIIMDQNQSTMKLTKIVLRGRREINVSENRIIWRSGIYKILESSRYASRSDIDHTLLYCHKIDLMNSSTSPAIDTTAPTVTSTVPLNNAVGVTLTSNVTVTFSEQIAVSSGNYVLINLTDNSLVPFAVSYSASTKTITLNPTSNLTTATQYMLLISGVNDLNGNVLASTVTRLFTTV